MKLDEIKEFENTLDPGVPAGPIQEKWDQHRFNMTLIAFVAHGGKLFNLSLIASNPLEKLMIAIIGREV